MVQPIRRRNLDSRQRCGYRSHGATEECLDRTSLLSPQRLMFDSQNTNNASVWSQPVDDRAATGLCQRHHPAAVVGSHGQCEPGQE